MILRFEITPDELCERISYWMKDLADQCGYLVENLEIVKSDSKFT